MVKYQLSERCANARRIGKSTFRIQPRSDRARDNRERYPASIRDYAQCFSAVAILPVASVAALVIYSVLSSQG